MAHKFLLADTTNVNGLYDASFEHDSCGFGLIACLDNIASSWLVQTSLSALARMSHRGAVGADGKTGDGCGVLIHQPTAFLRAAAIEAGIDVPAGLFAVGMVFLPQDMNAAAQTRAALQAALLNAGLTPLGWRVVPINVAVCGVQALAAMPQISQIFSTVQHGTAAFSRFFIKIWQQPKTYCQSIRFLT